MLERILRRVGFQGSDVSGLIRRPTERLLRDENYRLGLQKGYIADYPLFSLAAVFQGKATIEQQNAAAGYIAGLNEIGVPVSLRDFPNEAAEEKFRRGLDFADPKIDPIDPHKRLSSSERAQRSYEQGAYWIGAKARIRVNAPLLREVGINTDTLIARLPRDSQEYQKLMEELREVERRSQQSKARSHQQTHPVRQASVRKLEKSETETPSRKILVGKTTVAEFLKNQPGGSFRGLIGVYKRK